jgi:hypothetical protein
MSRTSIDLPDLFLEISIRSIFRDVFLTKKEQIHVGGIAIRSSFDMESHTYTLPTPKFQTISLCLIMVHFLLGWGV